MSAVEEDCPRSLEVLAGADAKGVITMKRVRGVRLTRSTDGPQLEIAVGDALGDRVKRTFYFLAADDASGYAWRLAIEAASSHEHMRHSAVTRRMTQRQSTAVKMDLADQVIVSAQIHRGQRLSAAHSISHGTAGSFDHRAAARAAAEGGGAAQRIGIVGAGGGGPSVELLCGALHKQDHGALSKKFKERYFVLRSSGLDYYRTDSREEHLKAIPMSEIVEAYSAFERGLSKFDGEFHVRVTG